MKARIRHRTFLLLTGLFYLIFFNCQGFALSLLKLFPKKEIYFKNRYYIVHNKTEKLQEIAVKTGLGYFHLFLANKGKTRFKKGEKVLLPYQVIIPEEFQKFNGIIVNLPEMRLYYIKQHKYFWVAPVGIAKKKKFLPKGTYRVIKKSVNPPWFPPPSIRKTHPWLPKVIPPNSPKNPLGGYILYLDRDALAIHGTNNPFSIGKMSSHGCIRLYRRDIKVLYHFVKVGTKVRFVYNPCKVGFEKGKVYLQCFPPLKKKKDDLIFSIMERIENYCNRRNLGYEVNFFKISKILENPDGLVYQIGILYKLEDV